MTRAETVAALIDHGFEDGKDVSCGLYEFVHVAQYVDNYRRAIYSSVMLNVNEDGSVNGLKISNIASSESYKNARFVDGEIKPQISEDDFKDMMGKEILGAAGITDEDYAQSADYDLEPLREAGFTIVKTDL